MRFKKYHNLMITSIFERKSTLRVARCSRNYSMLDEDVPKCVS